MKNNPYDIVAEFEKQVAEYAGAKYGVAVESGTAAIFLSLQYLVHVRGYRGEVTIPARTYPSVPCAIIQAGLTVKFDDKPWGGIYELESTGIIDSALRFRRGMYVPQSFYCLSFHIKKHLPIGRGGMILTDNASAVDWLKRARFDGRGECALEEDNLNVIGWNMYMQPEQAARGLKLFHNSFFLK
jgi:dTDP-4-amino-4,6-dideoxygalactose transaminase